jgi:hypothetical protein
MTSQSSKPPTLWPEPWAIQVAVDADRVEHRMRVIRSNGGDSSELRSSDEAVTHHLQAARDACTCSTKLRRRGALDRWRGTSVEQAYRNLHSAKIFLVDTLPDREVAALVPEVCVRIAAALDRNDPRRTEAEKAMHSADPAVVRAALKQAMEVSYDASDEEYVRLRNFRNIILGTAAILAVFTGLLLFLVARSPQAIPLCFTPSVTGAATTPTGTGSAQEQQARQVCPSGDQQQPTPGDILIIAGLGAVGGGFGALLAVRNLRGSSTPYGVPMALAVLKVPSGALTAVIGMLLLAGGFVPGLSNLDSQRQILAYALVFGYAQQIITRLADDRAQSIMNRLPSKDPEADQPVVATPAQPGTPTPGGRRPNGSQSAAGTEGAAAGTPPAPPTNGSQPPPTPSTQPTPDQPPAVTPAPDAQPTPASDSQPTPDQTAEVAPSSDAQPTPAAGSQSGPDRTAKAAPAPGT